MRAPQIIMIVLLASGLLIAAHDHGKQQKVSNFWTTLIASALMTGLLMWGGFFK